MGFEHCTGLDPRREEFYPSINMLCPGRSCALGLAGAWEKLSSHSISNAGAWGLLTPGLLVHMGHPARKLSDNFQEGRRSKSTACVS